jgi:uncharacterized protein (DUF1330 family)
MPAYFIAVPRELTSDPRIMLPYQQQIEATMASYGGRYRVLLRHAIEVVEGDWPLPLGLVIVEFPDIARARAWYQSPEYAPLLAQRLANNQFDAILVDGLADGVTLLSLGILSPRERSLIAELERAE